MRGRNVAKTYRRVEVLAKRDAGTHDTSEVENSPEDTDESSFLALWFAISELRHLWGAMNSKLTSGVRQHQGTLCGPQKTSTNTKDRACGNNEASCPRMHVQ